MPGLTYLTIYIKLSVSLQKNAFLYARITRMVSISSPTNPALSFISLNRLYRISKHGSFESRDRADLPTKEKKQSWSHSLLWNRYYRYLCWLYVYNVYKFNQSIGFNKIFLKMYIPLLLFCGLFLVVGLFVRECIPK